MFMVCMAAMAVCFVLAAIWTAQGVPETGHEIAREEHQLPHAVPQSRCWQAPEISGLRRHNATVSGVGAMGLDGSNPEHNATPRSADDPNSGRAGGFAELSDGPLCKASLLSAGI
jgi:hypothetical protein